MKYRFNPMLFNQAYLPYIKNNSRILLFYGGANSGKSYFISQRHVMRMLMNRHRNSLVVRKTAKSNRHSTFAQIQQIINAWNLKYKFDVNKTDMTITYKDYGNQTIFAGLDDVEKIKSTTFKNGILTDIWQEEANEAGEDDFEQLMLRQRGESPIPFQMVLSFNPVSKKLWLYRRFFENTDPRATIIKTTYLDNRWRGEDVDRDMELLKKNMPEYYQVYGLGEWGAPVEGFLFKRAFRQDYDVLPEDARGVIYCDPNLAKKGKGDTTAIVKLLFSPSRSKYYLADVICQSFSDSKELLSALMLMRADGRARVIGFDGTFGQESQWSQHVSDYVRQSGQAFPIIQYKSYKVDELAKNAQWLWNEGAIMLPRRLENAPDGQEFLYQLFSFAGKKHSKAHDDGPDALICAVELLYEQGMTRPAVSEGLRSVLIK